MKKTKPTVSEEEKIDRIAALLKLIANPIRLRILYLLVQHGQLSAGDIYEYLKSEGSVSLIYLYINRLDRKGMLSVTRLGNEMYCTLSDPVWADCIRAMLRTGESVR